MFTYGFYNSLNGDRKYDAVQMSSIFDGVIEDGVYANVGELFAVVAGTGMTVIVKTGRAWFDHTWSLLDAHLPLDIEESDFLQTRIDAVVLEVDSRISHRENSIKVVKGIPSVNPVKPTLLHEQGVYQHALAYVSVSPGVTSITADKIEIVVGKDETPFVQCPLKTVSISDLFNQWDEEFTAWFDNVKLQLTDNVVTNLQYQIDNKVNKADKATPEDIENGTPNKWVDAAAVSSLVPKVGDVVKPSEPDIAVHPDHYIKMDGSPIPINKIPENLRMKYKNMLPYAKPLPAVKGSYHSGNYQDCVLTFSDVSIGDYDYLIRKSAPNARWGILKLDRRTDTIVKEVNLDFSTTSSPSYVTSGIVYGVCNGQTPGSKVLVIFSTYGTMSGAVYDENLNRIRGFKYGNEKFAYHCATQFNSNRIVIVAQQYDSGTTPLPTVLYTDNLFLTITKAAFVNIPSSYTIIYTFPSSFSTTPFPKRYGNGTSSLYMIPTGRLFIIQSYITSAYFNPQTYYPLYYSDDYGTTWSHINLATVFNPSLVGATINESAYAWMVATDSTIYAFLMVRNSSSTSARILASVSINATSLSIGTPIKSIDLGENGYYIIPNSLYDVVAVPNSKLFKLLTKGGAGVETMTSLEEADRSMIYYDFSPFINLDTLEIEQVTNCENDILSISKKQSSGAEKRYSVYLDNYLFHFYKMSYGKFNGSEHNYYRSNSWWVLCTEDLLGDTNAVIGELTYPYSEYLYSDADQNYTTGVYYLVAKDRFYVMPCTTRGTTNSSTNITTYWADSCSWYYFDRTKLLLPPTGEYIKIDPTSVAIQYPEGGQAIL